MGEGDTELDITTEQEAAQEADPTEVSEATETEVDVDTQDRIDSEVESLDYIMKNPDFMLQTNNMSEADKEGMVQGATRVLESIQPELEETPSLIQDPDTDFTPIPVKFTDNTELTDKVPKIKLSEIVGKKTNYVMADQLVTKGDMLGGPLFGLSDANYGKVAWASTRDNEALNIIRGALDADFSTVYNMSPSAIDSNQVGFIKLAEKIDSFDNSDEFFTLINQAVIKSPIGVDNKKSLKQASEESNTVTDFFNSKAFKKGLNLKQKAVIFTKILPSRKVDAGTNLGKLFQDKGISLESIREEISEKFTQGLSPGVLLTLFEVQDKQGNKLT
jgi:hypothetical protein